MTFSILILTLDEEANLDRCLASVHRSDDVVVLDSFSTDRTVELAKTAGARVYQRVFDDFASQRNHALDYIDFKHPWIFHLDADERFTDELRQECSQVIAEDGHSGFFVPSRMMFMGKWLKYSGLYPSYQMRLMKLGEVRFVQKGHGQREGDAKRGIGVLRNPYLHFSFTKGLSDWFEKHNRYSSDEAAEGIEELNSDLSDLAGLLAFRDPVRRRAALKRLSVRLPFRPTLRFLYMYLWRKGFLDGRPGLTYCRLLAMYEYMIVLKMRELKVSDFTIPLLT